MNNYMFFFCHMQTPFFREILFLNIIIVHKAFTYKDNILNVFFLFYVLCMKLFDNIYLPTYVSILFHFCVNIYTD